MLKVHHKTEYMTVWKHERVESAEVTIVKGSTEYYVNNKGRIVFNSGDLENCRRFIEYLYMIN